MAKPTRDQKHSDSPLDAAYVQATGRQSDHVTCSWETGGDWSAVPRVLIALASAGGAVMFGRTRDGGQLTVAIYHNGDKATHYFDNASQVLDYLESVANISGAL